MPVATAYIPNIYNIYIPIYSSILRVRYVVAMNSYRIKILLISVDTMKIMKIYSNIPQYIIRIPYFQQPGPMARRVISWLIFCIFFLFQGYWELLHIPFQKSLQYFLQYFLSFRRDLMEPGLNFAGWSINWYSIQLKFDSEIANS